LVKIVLVIDQIILAALASCSYVCFMQKFIRANIETAFVNLEEVLMTIFF